MKFGARLNALKEGGREGGREGNAPPIVRVDIVVGGSGSGDQAPLARSPPEASGRVEWSASP